MKEMLANNEGLMDRTYLLDNKLQHFIPQTQPSIPEKCTREKLVNELIDLLDVNFLYDNLIELTQFWNRFYTSQFGVNSAEWIYEQYQTMISNTPNDLDISVQFVNHTWAQPSVIASIQGIGDNKDEIVIVGAHLDSVNWDAQNQDISRAPGACDNGSGTVTVMELFRVIAESGLSFNRTIEFHHYAAEEVGLLGSQDIANNYAGEEKPVAAYLNFDMDGYPGNPALFNVITDYTDSSLNEFLYQLIDTYATIEYSSSDCGYGCSDHASWDQAGYRASFAIENGPYPYAHGPEDKLEYLFLPYAIEYCR
eukprot:CAMPEP_0117019190 /NCGR_PEP_ID=MMETSP0472-20121206/14767_1 /TAXON_ID=693140 ORGANISM="Tiarina fusus, Strain LIS" /NCGR_SAMPLE_ID=MMETSP0472 /ASSEMBLY_ACC=CAM_ASM_000603 /LENGTH=308 /DNA_ID=CAMNT_0004724105 /DNA_START=118 /DNA_END=1040 /DNA_ORIENTATION=-